MIDEAQDQFLSVVTVEDDPSITSLEDSAETIIELTLDSGYCDHVLFISDTPGYACVLGPSPGSKQGHNFIVGRGERLLSQGQTRVNMEAEDACGIKSSFQVAGVSRPLMNVS